MAGRIRTVLFSTLYPSSARPLHGIFVQTRLHELLKLGRTETRIVAPVPWVPPGLRNRDRYRSLVRTPRHESLQGVKVDHPRYILPPRFGMTYAPLALAMASLPTLLRVRREGFDFDLIDAHYYYPDGVAAAILGKWLSRPVAITARGTDLNLIPQFRVPRAMIKWAARKAAASIGVSAALTQILKDLGADPLRLHTLRNGVDTNRFSSRPMMEARQRLGMSANPVLLSVGNLVELKGHDIIVDAMKRILIAQPHAHLYIIGEGEQRANLRRQIDILGVVDHVTLVGAVLNEDLADWYSAADVLLHASSREGWPNVLLESMACGTPVVATNVGGVAEVIASDRYGVALDKRTPESFAEAVLMQLASPLDRQEIRSYASRMSWQQTSAATAELFEQLCRPE